MSETSHPPNRPPSAFFVTTQWTRVLAARGRSADAQSALSELCETYYEPVVAFLRCSGRSDDDAREAAHQFFARLLEGGGLERLERGRGRFRSYLLGAVKHFLVDLRRHDRAERRGAGHEHLALNAETDTSLGLDVPDATSPSPEVEFDRQWALTLLERALRQMESEYVAVGKGLLFEVLKPWLTGDNKGLSQADAARQLAMNEGAVKVAIHRLRRRFRQSVKAEIAQTVADSDQVGEELRCLIAALGSL